MCFIFLSIFSRYLEPEEYKSLSNQIVKVFPNEDPLLYYTGSTVKKEKDKDKDKNKNKEKKGNTKSENGVKAGGRLPIKMENARKLISRCGLQNAEKRNEPEPEKNLFFWSTKLMALCILSLILSICLDFYALKFICYFLNNNVYFFIN